MTLSEVLWQLRLTLGKLELALSAVEDAVVLADQAGRVQWCNESFARLARRPRAELLGLPLLELVALRTLEGRSVADVIERCGAGRQCVCRAEAPGRSLEVSATRVEFGGGEAGMVVTMHDVTRRLEAEAAAAAAFRELDSFCAAAAHDLRAPARTITGFGDALERRLSSRLDAQERELLDGMRRGCRRLGAIVDDLLGLSRVGRAPLRRERVDLTAMAGRVGAELARRDPGRRVELVVAPGLEASADAGLLEVALTNLLDNAFKFTGAAARPRVEVGSRREEGGEVFFVKDNGAGFDAAHAGRLFQPFERLHSQREFPGTGIGLTTVRRVVERHGGRVWAEGRPGGGAEFYFTLG